METSTKFGSCKVVTEEIGKLFVLTGHWQSDLKFFQEELHFLDRLIAKYLIWLDEDENIRSTRTTLGRLSTLKSKGKELEDSIARHLVNAAELHHKSSARGENRFRGEHGVLEGQFADMVSSSRAIKREVFALTESLIDQEQISSRIETRS